MDTNNIKSKKMVKCVDAILEFLIKVYQHEIKEDPTADNANSYVAKKVKNLEAVDFIYAHHIAHDLGYIRYITYEHDENSIKEFRIETKGTLVFLNGGHKKIRRKDVLQNRMLIIVQIAASIGGIHYLIQIAEKIFSWIAPCHF